MLPSVEQMIIRDDAVLQDALSAIDKNEQGVVFVVDKEEKLCGILTDGDLRRSFLKNNSLKTLVREVMNVSYLYRHVETDSEEIAGLLNERIRHIPLVNSKGHLVDYACIRRLSKIPIMEPYLGGNEFAYVTDCLKKNWLSSRGKYVRQFEDLFAKICGGGHALAVSNGTVALHLALKTLGIGPGDEVIVPDLTFAATINAVIHAGATPVLVDVSPRYWGLDPDKTEKAITSKTKAVLPVHLYGHPCDMDLIQDIARPHNLWVIEDCAEALGATYKGRPVGLLGDAGCFSFFGNKLITTGEGGMVVFKDSKHAERAKILRDHGMSKGKTYWHTEIGYNYRMTNLQAAVGLAQLEQFDEFCEKKLAVVASYKKILKDHPGITLPQNQPWAHSIFWLFTILVEASFFGKRDDLIQTLRGHGIDSRPVFYPLHMMPIYKKFADGQFFPVSDEISIKGISLPSSLLLTESEIQEICRTLARIKCAKEMSANVSKQGSSLNVTS